MLIGLLLAGNLAAFGNNGINPVPPSEPVYYGQVGRGQQLRLRPLFWERDDVQEVVAKAVTVAKEPSPLPLRLAALRRETLALANTVALRDEVRSQFYAHVAFLAAQAQRQDDELALLLLIDQGL